MGQRIKPILPSRPAGGNSGTVPSIPGRAERHVRELMAPSRNFPTRPGISSGLQFLHFLRRAIMKSRARLAGLFAIILWVTACSRSTAQTEFPIPKIAVEKFQLANGLEVLMVEDHRLPRVSVEMWYHVGPVN